VDDTRKWLMWLSQECQLPSIITECLMYDGPTLCSLSEQELTLLTGSPDTGLKVSAQLEIWKNGELYFQLFHECSIYHD